MHARQTLGAAIAVIATMTATPGCVWKPACVNGATRIDGRCVRAATDGGGAGTDASVIDASLDGAVPDAPMGLDGGARETITSFAVAAAHICVTTSLGRLRCWGANVFGQLAQGDVGTYETPVNVDLDGAGALAVTGDALHTCARDDRARVWCWGGDNANGEIGVPTAPTPVTTPTQVMGLGSPLALAAGFANTCAVAITGTRCWGRNDNGQVSIGFVGAPVTMPGAVVMDDSGALEGATSVSIADRHICFRHGGESQVLCAGQNSEGQLGDGTTTDHATAVLVGLADVAHVSAAFSHTCAVTGAGQVYCWGANQSREVAPDLAIDVVSSPHVVPGITNAIDVEIGEHHACALIDNGTVRCWGSRAQGALGDGLPESDGPPSMPVTVSGLSDATALGNSLLTLTCALRETGVLACWGQDAAGTVTGGGAGVFLDGMFQHSTPVDVNPL